MPGMHCFRCSKTAPVSDFLLLLFCFPCISCLEALAGSNGPLPEPPPAQPQPRALQAALALTISQKTLQQVSATAPLQQEPASAQEPFRRAQAA